MYRILVDGFQFGPNYGTLEDAEKGKKHVPRAAFKYDIRIVEVEPEPTTPYDEGFDAGVQDAFDCADENILPNPYAHGTDEAKQWELGYDEGRYTI